MSRGACVFNLLNILFSSLFHDKRDLCKYNVSMTDRRGLAFRRFWEETGERFPDLEGAPSTAYYRECEKALVREAFSPMAGKKIFKTDLWDEAKNTRILVWMAEEGARVFGADISLSILQRARRSFPASGFKPGLIVSDLRRTGFADESFDGLYSMGTFEHFPEYEDAVRECFRLLKPGGLAVIGVPNRLDPFLRPLFVRILIGLGLYAYGSERSFTHRRLQRLLEQAGFRVLERSGILFLPGWLRIAELWVHARHPRWTFLFRPLIGMFSFLYFRFPSLRRHGYLIVCLARRPEEIRRTS